MQTIPRVSGFFRAEPKRLGETQVRPRVPEPTAEERRVLDLVEKRYSYARDAKKALLETWATCLAFYVGEQYRTWNQQQRRLVQPAQIPEWRVRTKDNQIPGILDTAANKLSRSRKEPKALANTNDPEDHAAAELGTAALRHWWDTDAMDRKELEANIGRLLFGCSFFHDLWDPAKMARVPVPRLAGFDQMGQPQIKTEVKRAPVGDVTVEVLSVFDVFPEPAEEWGAATWCLVARRKPLSWFRDTFPVEGKWVEADSAKMEDVFAGFNVTGFEVPGSAPAGEGMATLKIYYERPTRDYPQGRHAMIAGGRVLFARATLPLPHLEIPVAMMGYRYVPKRLWPKGLVEELIGPQQELNRGLSNLAEIVRLFRSMKWVVAKGSVDEKAITSKPDEVIEYKNGTQIPQLISPPNLPAQVIQYPEMQREELRQLSGQRDLAPGGIPAGVTAASALALIDQQNNERLSTPAKYGQQAIQTVATRVLQTIAERWREDRLVSTFGRDRQQQVQAFRGADIGDRDVLVDLTEGVQDTDAVRFQQLTEWFQLGVFQMMQQVPAFAKTFPQLLREVGQEWLADDIEKYGQALVEDLARQEQQQQAMMAQQGQAQDQQAQMQAQGEARKQALEAQRTQVQTAAVQQKAATDQQMAQQSAAVQAQQANQALAQADARHQQELAHAEDRHRLDLTQRMQSVALAAHAARMKQDQAKKG